jgi:hypothetical protein
MPSAGGQLFRAAKVHILKKNALEHCADNRLRLLTGPARPAGQKACTFRPQTGQRASHGYTGDAGAGSPFTIEYMIPFITSRTST